MYPSKIQPNLIGGNCAGEKRSAKLACSKPQPWDMHKFTKNAKEFDPCQEVF